MAAPGRTFIGLFFIEFINGALASASTPRIVRFHPELLRALSTSTPRNVQFCPEDCPIPPLYLALVILLHPDDRPIPPRIEQFIWTPLYGSSRLTPRIPRFTVQTSPEEDQ